LSKQRRTQGDAPAAVTPLARDELSPLAVARALADAAAEAILLAGTDARVLHANAAARALLAAPGGELRGRALHDLVPGLPAGALGGAISRTWQARVTVPGDATVELALRLEALDPPRTTVLALTARRTAAGGETAEVELERWALAARGSSDGFWHRPDIGLDFAWWSPRVYELLGYVPGEIEPRFSAILERLHPLDRDRYLAVRERELLGDAALDAEFRLRHRSGEYRHFRARARVARAGAGRPASLSGSLQDVTERVRMERALRESEERFRTLVDNAPIEIFLKDREGRYVLVNERVVQAWGRPAHEIIGRRAADLFDEALARRTERDDRTVLERNEALARELVAERQGRRVHLARVKFPIPDASGRPAGIATFTHDVTERARVLEALEASERRFRDFADLAADYLWETDEHLAFTFLSERFRDLNGIPAEAALGKSIIGLFDDRGDDEEVLARHCANLEARRPTQVELTRTRPDGTTVRVHIRGRPVFDAEGRFAGYRGITRDITEAHELAARLSFQATHDALTGLVNRAEFERRLGRLLDSARRDGSSHALCYLDLDQFKVVNDTCGHLAGDALLERLAETLTFRVRQRDTVARLGGDEFAVLIEHCSVAQATRVASALHQAISEFVFTWNGRPFQVGASLGLVPITPDLGDVNDVLSAADSACYVAKDQGRNRIHVYAKDDAELTRRRGEMNWVSHISGALAENRFRLRAQPVVPLSPRNAGSHHCELLVVMIDRDGNEVQPGAFLPAAERYNLATRIDRWVVRAALEWLAGDGDARGRPALAGINLSAQSLGELDFLDFVRGESARLGVPASRLCFEITETAAIANLDTARRFMGELEGDGARFALDDFGKGLSSFGYLRSLPVDYIKIDAQFVRNLSTDPIDLAIVRSIHEVARLMEKQTIAEGVESHEVLRTLRSVGVDYAQGFAVARPRFI